MIITLYFTIADALHLIKSMTSTALTTTFSPPTHLTIIMLAAIHLLLAISAMPTLIPSNILKITTSVSQIQKLLKESQLLIHFELQQLTVSNTQMLESVYNVIQVSSSILTILVKTLALQLLLSKIPLM